MGVRDDLQRCLNCILAIGGNAINPNLVTSGQRAADGTSGLVYILGLCTDTKLPAFTTACENASFKVERILVQNPTNATPTVLSGPIPSGNRNGASPVAACRVSGLAFIWGVTMLLL